MNFIRRIAGAIGLKSIYHTLRDVLLKLTGYKLLNPEQTAVFLAPYQVKEKCADKIHLPQIANSADTSSTIFPEKEAIADTVYVWEYTAKTPVKLGKYGSVVIDKNVLSTDTDYYSFYIGLRESNQRNKKEIPAIITLFSQFQDGIIFGGYYDFIFLVAAKLCRIKDALSPEEFEKIPIAYPLFGTSYESEYMQMLGVHSNRLINTTETKVTSTKVITGNSARWYPNPSDIASLKRHIAGKFQPIKTDSKRIYISRKDRRKIVNEAELIPVLQKFGFVIIEDKPRSIISQISLYYNASFILGPHGASFSNIIWCQPGTHLVELFSSNYAPDFFLYLATMNNMKYSAYYEQAPQKTNYLEALVEDIYVDVTKLDQFLSGIFNQ